MDKRLKISAWEKMIFKFMKKWFEKNSKDNTEIKYKEKKKNGGKND